MEIDHDSAQANRRDSRLQSSPTKHDGPAKQAPPPTNCIGHLDREEYFSPHCKWDKHVFHAWVPHPRESGNGKVVIESLKGSSGNQHDGGEDAQVSSEHAVSPPPNPTGAFQEAADVTPDAIISALTGLQPSDRRVLEAGEDIYFATRLASACVTLYGRGWASKIKTLARWSVDLVGKSMWDKVVLDFGEAANESEDDEKWASFLLAEVIINLKKLDEGRAAELREMVTALEEDGVLPEAA